MNGCNTSHPKYEPRRDGYMAQDGWTEDGRRNMVYQPNNMSRDCKYDRTEIDPKCANCERIPKNGNQ